ncbi:ThiF family adenylyltransferase, partial [Eggerthella sinensis]|uniref:ThiF family adenylyltransferase n=1 Tax=Eggerthella sinensis TaxID=242230 RepID=UPI0022E76545
MDALARRIGATERERLAEARVGVAGLGGLGSHIAVMLARSGVGMLHLVDFDRVDEGNLNRQHYFPRAPRLPRVGVAGLGGLGSHIAVMLARSGVGMLHLVDFDRVD